MIGGKADQKETLRALQHSMGFIRHELGRTLRIKRIPALHVHLDDTAERGTRVLHLLQELEEGKEPETIAPYDESLPKPVQRLPHEGDAETEGFGGAAADHAAMPPAAARSPRAGRRPVGDPAARAPAGARRRKTPRRAPKQHNDRRDRPRRRSRVTPSRHPSWRA